MPLANPVVGTKEEEEWQELQAVLQSGILDKAPNLRHFLAYVGEQHFAGNTEHVKEYSIAVQALHRHEQFDPQADTIVRVTAHTLRKKLEQYYASEGADHSIQIKLPAGKYVLQFERREQARPPSREHHIAPPAPEEAVPTAPRTKLSPKILWAVLAIAGAAVLFWQGTALLRRWQPEISAKLENMTPAAKAGGVARAVKESGMTPDSALRIRFAASQNPYVDVAGQTWRTEQYCKGGTTFSHPDREIQGTDDPALFQEGREGRFQCRIPAQPGSYQLLLLFADTAGDKEAARQVDISINNTVSTALDVVDEAGGDNAVVGKVFGGIHPMSDGTIHVDFTSDGSFINAVELTPAGLDDGVSLRMLAGPATFRDDQGNTWFPERFFRGGRRSFHPDDLPKVTNSRLFAWERYGHFRYVIPVVAGKEYRVRLYFSEGWFGKGNGGPGGIGSRLFDVYCNGTTLLRNLDILKEQQNGAAVITFDRVKPTAHGMLELYFTPVKNYPLINAVEVVAQN